MKWFVFVMYILAAMESGAQEVLALYGEGPVPNALPTSLSNKTDTVEGGKLRVSRVVTPYLIHYAPAATGRPAGAVVICPGGGYGRLAIDHEGHEVAQVFASWGLHAFVLVYRLPDSTLQADRTIAPLQDAQQAIALVRSKAEQYLINPAKVGIMGFSAGGHLASTAATHFSRPVHTTLSPQQVRPDAAILIYPVISFTDSLMHRGSRDNLLGRPATADQVSLYSNELQVTAQTPPGFLVHAGDDRAVKVENSLAFYLALKRHGVPAEMHVYPKGGHGFGMNNPTTTDRWMERLAHWLQGLGWIEPPK